MTSVEFMLLPAEEQVQHVWENGRYLLNKGGQKTTANLYAVDNFYVEILFSRKNSAIARIISFTATSKLDSYLNDISLEGLL